MRKMIVFAGAAFALGGCSAASIDIQKDELANARAAIAAARQAGAERCAPKELAKAEATLYQAAHELDETGMHPEETASLIASAEKMAHAAKQKARANCAPKPKPAPKPKKPEIIALSGVNFETNSARLTPESLAVLDRAVATLKRRPDIRVEVAAHTDSIGKASYNQALSERRAQSVYRYLVDHGIDPARLTARGYGESQPVASNATAAGRAKNRRVELRVLK